MNTLATDKRPRLAGREGFVLPAVIFALAIMSILAVAALRTAGDEQRSSRAVRESGTALYAAESGIHQVKATWPEAAANALTAGDSMDSGWQPIGNGASRRVVIQRVNTVGQGMWAVRVEGRGAGPSGGQRALSVMVTEAPLFTWVTFGRDAMSIAGGAITGDVGTNGNLTLSGSVTGNATVGGTVSDPTSVTGTVTEGAPPVTLDPVACPATPFGPEPDGTGFSFDPISGDLQISGSSNITFPTGTYYYHDVKITGGAQLEVPLGQTAQLYISNDLKMGGNGFINQNNTSEALQVWGCGTSVIAWDIGGSFDAWMILYAPDHPLKLSGSGNRYGSFTSATITKSGSGTVEYDLALEDGGGDLAIVGGSWVQLLY